MFTSPEEQDWTVSTVWLILILSPFPLGGGIPGGNPGAPNEVIGGTITRSTCSQLSALTTGPPSTSLEIFQPKARSMGPFEIEK